MIYILQNFQVQLFGNIVENHTLNKKGMDKQTKDEKAKKKLLTKNQQINVNIDMKTCQNFDRFYEFDEEGEAQNPAVNQNSGMYFRR